MKPVRALLIPFAGLVLAGCASQSASRKAGATPPKDVAIADEPVSGRDYWMMRDLEDGLERMRDRASSSTARP